MIGRSRAKIVEDDGAKRVGLDVIMAHYGSDQGEYKKAGLEAAFVIKAATESMSGKKSAY
jgi:hypothetical protein